MSTAKANKKKYILPKFDLQKLLDHLQDCVDKAANGVVTFYYDLFCGCGGDADGLEKAKSKDGRKCYAIIAGINHDLKAIYSHAINHPLAYYSTEDIKTANLDKLNEIIAICRDRWPQCPVIAWGSVECTNNSNAKGGQSRDADSRTLPVHLFRYVRQTNIDGLWVENVREFLDWGPLMRKVVMFKARSNWSFKVPKNKSVLEMPVKKDKDIAFFTEKIAEGFICCSPLSVIKNEKKKKIGLGPTWVTIKSLKGTCYKPWRDKVKRLGDFDVQEWKLNAADFGVPQNRKRAFIIFMKKDFTITKPEATHHKDGGKDGNTLLPHVAIKTCLDFSQEGKSIFETITSDKSYERVYAGLLKFVAGGKEEFMVQRNSGNPIAKIYPVDTPARAVTSTGGNQDLVKVNFIVNQQGKSTAMSVGDASPTVMVNNKLLLTTVKYFIYNAYSSGGQTNSIDQVSPCVTNIPKSRLIQTEPWIMNTNYDRIGTATDEPSPPLLASRRHYYIVNPSWINNPPGDINDPSFVIIARQDKSPLYLITATEGENRYAIPVYKTDSEIVVKIKEFMVMYKIKDINIRMLDIIELLKIQSFPADYYLAEGKTDQKKFIGNAVPPLLAQRIAEAMYTGILSDITNKFKLAA